MAETLSGHDEPEPELEERQADIREQIRGCDRRLARYRTALDHGDGEIDAITTGSPKSSETARAFKPSSAGSSRAAS